MKNITIMEHIRPDRMSFELYDYDTGEFLREYRRVEIEANLAWVKRDQAMLANVKVPTSLEESNLWC